MIIHEIAAIKWYPIKYYEIKHCLHFSTQSLFSSNKKDVKFDLKHTDWMVQRTPDQLEKEFIIDLLEWSIKYNLLNQD
jgi:hypothetical protein